MQRCQQQIKKIKVGITLGDVAGIGLKIIIKTFSDELIFKTIHAILFGNQEFYPITKKMLNIEKFQYASVKGYNNLSHNALNIIPVWEEEFQITREHQQTLQEIMPKIFRGSLRGIKNNQNRCIGYCTYQ